MSTSLEHLAQTINRLSPEEKKALNQLLKDDWQLAEQKRFELSDWHYDLLLKAERSHLEGRSKSYSFEEVKSFTRSKVQNA